MLDKVLVYCVLYICTHQQARDRVRFAQTLLQRSKNCASRGLDEIQLLATRHGCVMMSRLEIKLGCPKMAVFLTSQEDDALKKKKLCSLSFSLQTQFFDRNRVRQE